MTPQRAYLRVRLEGVKNPKLASATEVEIKAGLIYEKQMYSGVPLVFDLEDKPEVDMVRITWPNGLIQSEARQAANRTTVYKESQRLSGSCPLVWTWNGRGFEFISDVLGVAPLGASAGDGKYFPVDHTEYVSIPADALKLEDGRYEVLITDELAEVSYIDQVRLLAVDHPAGVDIYTNEKFKSPPFPEYKLFGVSRRIAPIAAHDSHGRDVLDLVLHRDGRYPDGFHRTMGGAAEPWYIDLDFGQAAPDNRAILVLNGWVDWADGSTFLQAAQQSREGLVMPSLQVQDAQGRWQTVIEDMGMPSGWPRSIVVDLTGKFLSKSRAVRIATNVCVYWDEIFLSVLPPTRRRACLTAPMLSADLHFRGFSRVAVHPQRTQPERFFYDRPRAMAMWDPTPGLYTRYGEVGELLDAVDDRFVIMGAGDEARLRFDARCSAPPARWMAARFPLESGRLVQGPRCQHGLLAERRAAAVPCHERLPLCAQRALSGRCRASRLHQTMEHAPGAATPAVLGAEALTRQLVRPLRMRAGASIAPCLPAIATKVAEAGGASTLACCVDTRVDAPAPGAGWA